MTQRRLLVVDDEPLNLEIIRACLGEEHALELLPSADQAWAWLAAGGSANLVVLDRMMPGLDGLELLKRLKADARFAAIPVVMQTAASAPDEVREGIEAGAYYYLAKPYAPETLSAIVRAALADVEAVELARRRATAHVGALALLERASFRFAAIEEIGSLIEVLASLCPAPELAASGLTELLANAVEHGNLAITYDEKKRLRLENVWDAEVARRRALPEYRDRSVEVRVERHPDRIFFTIIDEGAGFDWRRYLKLDPERAMDPNGRGIALARKLGFASLDYHGCGNTVVAAVALGPAQAMPEDMIGAR